MKENKADTQVKFLGTRIKKALHLTTAVSFFLQQVVFCSPALGMEDEYGSNNNNSVASRGSPYLGRTTTTSSSSQTGTPERDFPLRGSPLRGFSSPGVGSGLANGVENGVEIRFSSVTSFPVLDEGLDELSQLIIGATNAERDVPFESRTVLERELSSLPSEFQERLKKFLPLLLPPEELLSSHDQHHPLISVTNLTPNHTEFAAVNLVIKELQTLAGEEKLPSSVGSALQDLEIYYTKAIKRFCSATSEERRKLLATRARLRGERLGTHLISQETARSLLSKDQYGSSARHKNAQEGGQSAVYAKGGVHFKAGVSSLSDIAPAMEWGLHAFTTLFVGDSSSRTSASGFLYLDNVTTKEWKNERAEAFINARKHFNEKVFSSLGERKSSKEFLKMYPHYKKYFTQEEPITPSRAGSLFRNRSKRLMLLTAC